MTDLTTEKLDEIRRLAKAATPGPWASEDECVLQPRPDLGILPGLTMETSVVVAECGGRAFDSPRPADAAFIAAVDPLTAKAMVEEILRLRAMVKVLERVREAAYIASRWIECGHRDDDHDICSAISESAKPSSPCDCGMQAGIDAKNDLRSALEAADQPKDTDR